MKRGLRKKKPRPTLRHEKKAKKNGFSFIAGVDEAGRGPVAGPLVCASVILKNTKFNSIIHDSKKLSPKKRLAAFNEISHKAHIGISILDEREIDRINIHNATALCMKDAINNLPVRADCVLVDGKIELDLPIEKHYIIEGDRKSLSIACASIVAKVIRDAIMDEYHKVFPEYGFAIHKGYATRRHVMKLKRFGPTPIHRFSFNPVKSLIMIYDKKRGVV